MRAYKCDACGKIFLMKDSSLNFEGPEDFEDYTDEHIPINLYYYPDHGIATCYDICKECGDRLMKTIEEINYASKIAEDYRFVKGG